MSESAGKRRKRYVDHWKDRSKPTCIIHGPGHSSDKCRFLGDLSSRYATKISTKDCGHDNANRKKFNRQKEMNDIVNSTVDEILTQENNKVSTVKETYENVEYDFDENKLYRIDNMSLDDRNGKF